MLDGGVAALQHPGERGQVVAQPRGEAHGGAGGGVAEQPGVAQPHRGGRGAGGEVSAGQLQFGELAQRERPDPLGQREQRRGVRRAPGRRGAVQRIRLRQRPHGRRWVQIAGDADARNAPARRLPAT